MGYKTKIDWCDSSWNPVTGCYHKCEYCHARGIATRFAGFIPEENPGTWGFRRGGTLVELDGMQARKRKNGMIVSAPYPFGFTPTLHRYRLDEPKKWSEPRTIFVCSMGELFGEWVPDEWIDEVFRATQQATQHIYLFLTKNPERYGEWLQRFEEGSIDGLHIIENCWLGASASNNDELERANRSRACWLSIEPIRERVDTDEDQFMEFRPYDGAELRRWEWVVIGAETGNSRNRVCPEKEWIEDIVHVCKAYGTPVFMKESLRGLMGDDFRQEFPWQY